MKTSKIIDPDFSSITLDKEFAILAIQIRLHREIRSRQLSRVFHGYQEECEIYADVDLLKKVFGIDQNDPDQVDEWMHKQYDIFRPKVNELYEVAPKELFDGQ